MYLSVKAEGIFSKIHIIIYILHAIVSPTRCTMIEQELGTLQSSLQQLTQQVGQSVPQRKAIEVKPPTLHPEHQQFMEQFIKKEPTIVANASAIADQIVDTNEDGIIDRYKLGSGRAEFITTIDNAIIKNSYIIPQLLVSEFQALANALPSKYPTQQQLITDFRRAAEQIREAIWDLLGGKIRFIQGIQNDIENFEHNVSVGLDFITTKGALVQQTITSVSHDDFESYAKRKFENTEPKYSPHARKLLQQLSEMVNKKWEEIDQKIKAQDKIGLGGAIRKSIKSVTHAVNVDAQLPYTTDLGLEVITTKYKDIKWPGALYIRIIKQVSPALPQGIQLEFTSGSINPNFTKFKADIDISDEDVELLTELHTATKKLLFVIQSAHSAAVS